MIVYVSKGEKKGAIVERFIRTLKSRIEMMFTETGKHVWVDTLDYFIANYNDSYHRSIKMAPSSVTLEKFYLNVFQMQLNVFSTKRAIFRSF